MGNKAKLRKLMVRFYPPGLILQYDVGGFVKQKPIDLLDLGVDTDLEVGTQQNHAWHMLACVLRQLVQMVTGQLLVTPTVQQVMVTHIISQEPLVGESKRPLLRQLLQRLIAKQLEPQALHFDLLKVSCGVWLRPAVWPCPYSLKHSASASASWKPDHVVVQQMSLCSRWQQIVSFKLMSHQAGPHAVPAGAACTRPALDNVSSELVMQYHTVRQHLVTQPKYPEVCVWCCPCRCCVHTSCP